MYTTLCATHFINKTSVCYQFTLYITHVFSRIFSWKYDRMSRIFSSKNSAISVSGVDEVVGEADSKRSKKENKSLISSAKKEKKKSKEKETRYAHLGDESSGEDEADGK